MIKQKNTSSGFVVLYAMLVAGMLLSVGLAIFNITFKETTFAGVSRDSNLALYAADTGRECALYWDNKYNNTTGDGSLFIIDNSGAKSPVVGEAKCNGQDLVSLWGTPTMDATSATTKFTLSLPNNSSADVTVLKVKTGTAITTTITSQGYNAAQGTPNRIQRTLVSAY